MSGIGIVRVPSGISTSTRRPSSGSRARPSRAMAPVPRRRDIPRGRLGRRHPRHPKDNRASPSNPTLLHGACQGALSAVRSPAFGVPGIGAGVSEPANCELAN